MHPPVSVYANFAIDLIDHGHTEPEDSASKLRRRAQFGHCVLSCRALTTTEENPCQVLFHASHSREETLLTIEYLHAESLANIDPTVPVLGERVPLCHAERCPAYLVQQAEHAEKLEKLDSRQQIRVAVCVMIEHDGHILLTRRSKTQRTFPLRWVFPGGHVDRDESLKEAAKREVLEETGLEVDILEPFGIWESCYPTYIEMGSPVRQHIVIYYRATLAEKVQLSGVFPFYNSLTIERLEVDQACWLNGNEVKAIMGDEKPSEDALLDCLVIEENEQRVVKKPLTDFKIDRLFTEASYQFEALALGTVFIMKQFLKYFFANGKA